ncbi:MAG TPA: T9SS type A sorting domain-containing protein, partial [Bacteroidia bacterium]|nr:T9SS type A sorting domain-containing protein [Bacteroidia bacterium]
SKIGVFYWFVDGSVFGGQTPVGLQYRILYTNYCNSKTGAPEIKYTVFPKSIFELNNKAVYVYPNPASSVVTIAVTEQSPIKLTDLQGREIPYQLISSDNETTTLDVSALSNGIYLLHIQSGNTTATHKLVVQH